VGKWALDEEAVSKKEISSIGDDGIDNRLGIACALGKLDPLPAHFHRSFVHIVERRENQLTFGREMMQLRTNRNTRFGDNLSRSQTGGALADHDPHRRVKDQLAGSLAAFGLRSPPGGRRVLCCFVNLPVTCCLVSHPISTRHTSPRRGPRLERASPHYR